MNPNDPNNPSQTPPQPGQTVPTPQTLNDPPISPIPGLDNALSGSPSPTPLGNDTSQSSPWSSTPSNPSGIGGPFPPQSANPVATPITAAPSLNPAQPSSTPFNLTPSPNEQPLSAPAPLSEPPQPPEPANPPLPTFVSPVTSNTIETPAQNPSFPPFLDPNTSTPPANNPNPPSLNNSGPLPSSEPAPTDLSQLTGSTEQPPPPDVYVPPVSNPENLVVPTPANVESIKPEGSNTSSILPKILIGIGLIIVLAVAGASAYYILGIGKPAEPPTSVPAQTDQSALTNPPTPAPASTPLPTTDPTATDSASLGDLNPQPTASGGSALDLLKSRTKPSTKPSATPLATTTP